MRMESQLNGHRLISNSPQGLSQASKDVEQIHDGILKAKKLVKSVVKELQLIQEILNDTSSPITSLDTENRFSTSRINLADLFITHEKCRLQDSEEDDEDTATVRRLNQENRSLLVQLDAAREALFTHQRKTQETMEKTEEDTQHLKRKLFDCAKREENAIETIRALQMALQDMQSEKQLVQRKTSESMEELSKTESRKQSDLLKSIERLNNEIAQKEDENIRLGMTILKVQEDLTRENHIKERAIDDRDHTIETLEKALADLRLENETRNMSEAFSKSDVSTASETEEEDASINISLLRKKNQEQEVELQVLRKENEDLRTKVEELENQNSNSANSVNGHASGDIPNTTKDKPKETEREEILLLQKRLQDSEEVNRKTQERADHMTLLLNQKLIELNKLQLTLSNQTKEMIQLEKAYFQLRCHLSKGFRPSSSASSRSRSSSRVDLTT